MIVALVGTFQLMKLLFTQWVLVEIKFRDMVGDISVDEIARTLGTLGTLEKSLPGGCAVGRRARHYRIVKWLGGCFAVGRLCTPPTREKKRFYAQLYRNIGEKIARPRFRYIRTPPSSPFVQTFAAHGLLVEPSMLESDGGY